MTASAPAHTGFDDTAMAAVGGGSTVMVMVSVNGCEQAGAPVVATLTKLKIVVVEYVLAIVAVPDPLRVMVWFAPPLMLYVTTAFGVPVKVTVAVCPSQIVTSADSDAVGSGMTVRVTLVDNGLTHAGVPTLVTEVSAMTVVVVYDPLMVATPAALSVTVCGAPPLRVYVTVAFAVPVIVTEALVPEQIVWFGVIDAIGSGRTVIVTDPVTGWLHPGVPDVETLTREIVVVAE